MRLEKDTSGFDKVAETAAKCANSVDKVANAIEKAANIRDKVGNMKTSTRVGLVLGGALALCLFPLRLAYDSETGEGEYRSLLVHVKRTQRPTREQTEYKKHDVSWEPFPTVRKKVADVRPVDLPPAQKCAVIKAAPMQVKCVQKAKVIVPVKLCAQEEIV